MDLSSDRIQSAIRWRMGLEENPGNAAEDWDTIEKWLRGDSERVDAVVSAMAWPFKEIIRWGLIEEGEAVPALWVDLHQYFQKRRQMTQWMMEKAASSIAENSPLKKSAAQNPVTDAETEFVPPVTAPAGGESLMDVGSPLEDETKPAESASSVEPLAEIQSAPASEPPLALESEETLPMEAKSTEARAPVAQSSTGAPAVSGPDSGGEADKPIAVQEPPAQNEQPTPSFDEAQVPSGGETEGDGNPPSVSTQWQYLAVPEGPDKHDEFDSRSAVSPEDLKIIGARARGKKHKHEGTNCDDWFEFGFSGPWTIIAVSDGAGSKIFSRIGAKTSCETALMELSDSLQDFALNVHQDWSGAKEDKKEIFAAEDLDVVRDALHNAMNKAYAAVDAKATALAEGEDREAYAKLLNGRPVTLDDLSGTLLLAVHTTVKHEGVARSFVMTCHIGDGMLAAVDGNGGLKLLGVADSGEFAGQTEFLTSKKKLEKSNLERKTFPFFGPIQALMVMTDGVADDYFPNDPKMLELYGDLVINGIIVLPPMTPNDVKASLSGTKLRDMEQVRQAGIGSPVDRILPPGESERVNIYSFARYVEKLGLPLKEVVKDPALLVGGTAGDPMCLETNPEDLLKVWLDSYNVRGSFDDRTLVVLYRETAS